MTPYEWSGSQHYRPPRRHRAVAGVAHQLAAKLPGSRVLDEAYLHSFVAIAVPKDRPAALAYASAFIDDAITSGSVRRALDKIGMTTSTVASPGTRP